MAPEVAIEEEHRALTELTGFQRDLLAATALAGEKHGLGVKETLEDLRDEQVHHGRLYPNLDDLVIAGLVEKGTMDKRTNIYEPTDDGLSRMRERADLLNKAWVAEDE